MFKLLNNLRLLWDAPKRIAAMQRELRDQDRRLQLLEQLVQVGVDVHPSRNGSWAVVCLQGKQDYVSFIDLGHADIHEIQSFIRRFSRDRRAVDVPHFMLRDGR